jgi:N-acetylmuramoyl-L-alanine amidase
MNTKLPVKDLPCGVMVPNSLKVNSTAPLSTDIIEELTRLKIPYVNIAPEYNDITLETRVKRANKYPAQNTFYLSIHSNAGGGTGTEVYSLTPVTSKSDLIATIFGEEFQKEFPTEKLRTDFSVTATSTKNNTSMSSPKPTCPPFSPRTSLWTPKLECKTILMTREGRTRIIRYHVAAILRVKIEVFKEN